MKLFQGIEKESKTMRQRKQIEMKPRKNKRKYERNKDRKMTKNNNNAMKKYKKIQEYTVCQSMACTISTVYYIY